MQTVVTGEESVSLFCLENVLNFTSCVLDQYDWRAVLDLENLASCRCGHCSCNSENVIRCSFEKPNLNSGPVLKMCTIIVCTN